MADHTITVAPAETNKLRAAPPSLTVARDETVIFQPAKARIVFQDKSPFDEQTVLGGNTKTVVGPVGTYPYDCLWIENGQEIPGEGGEIKVGGGGRDS